MFDQRITVRAYVAERHEGYHSIQLVKRIDMHPKSRPRVVGDRRERSKRVYNAHPSRTGQFLCHLLMDAYVAERHEE